MKYDDDVEALFNEATARARQEIKTKRAAASKKPADIEKQATQALYLDPANWERKRGIALIHEESETVLGNFSEYVHRSVPGCRKLVREESPIAVSARELVSGSWWLEDIKPEPRQVWHEQRTAFVHLFLDKLRVHSPACEVVVHLSYGSLARVELAVETQFAQQAGDAAQLLTLPAGANVLEVMSSDCKVGLLQDLGRGE